MLRLKISHVYHFSLPIRKATRRAVNVWQHATAPLLAPHGQRFLHYCTRVLLVHMELPGKQEAKKTTSIPSGGLSRFCRHRQSGPLTENSWQRQRNSSNIGPIREVSEVIPTAKTKAIRIFHIFIEHWVASLGLLPTVLTDNGRQFTSKYIAALCKELGVKTIMTTEYHLQANGRAERFNRTIAARLQRYVEEIQKDRDMFCVPPKMRKMYTPTKILCYPR